MATKKERILTPAGIAKFPRLLVPETKFTKDGVYSTQLPVRTKDAGELCALLEVKAKDALEKAKKDAPGKQIKLNPPYTIEYDEGGLPTGFTIFKFKSSARFTRFDGTVVDHKIPAFDSGCNKLPEMPNVRSGSKIRVNFTPIPYFVAAHRSAGLSLYINSVQIIELAAPNDGVESFLASRPSRGGIPGVCLQETT